MLNLRLLRLAFLFSYKNFIQGKQLVYFAALILAVSSISLLAWLNQGLNLGLAQQQTNLAGGELVISSKQPVETSLTDYLTQQGFKFSQQASLNTLLAKGEEFVLTQLIALDEQYPLAGQVKLKTSTAEINLSQPPLAGEIWLEEGLAARLKVVIGQKVEVGASELLVAGLVLSTPEQSNNFISFAPKAWVHQASLEATQLVGAFARVNYQLNLLTPPSIAGKHTSVQQLETYQQELENFLLASYLATNPTADVNSISAANGTEVKLSTNQQAPLAKAIHKLEDFLLILSLAGLVLASLAAVVASGHQHQQMSQNYALLLSFGLTPKQALSIQIGRLIIQAALASGLGLLFGWFALLGVAKIITQFLPLDFLALATAHSGMALLSWLVGIGLSLSLASTPLLALTRLNSWQALQGKGVNLASWGWLNLSLSFALLGLVTFWLSSSWLTNLLGLLVLLVLAALLTGLGWLTFKLLHFFYPKMPWLVRQILRQLRTRQITNLVQLVSLSLVLTLLLLVTKLADQLLMDWQELNPNYKPQIFAVDIPAAQVASFEKFLQQQELEASDFYPLTRARLTEINSQPLAASLSETELADPALHRELNLTWKAELPASNQLIAGDWWPANPTQNLISIEEGLAKRLSLNLGDTLGFSLAGSLVTGEIINIRKVNWQSLEPNFFIIFSPNSFAENSANYLTSFNINAAIQNQTEDTNNQLLVAISQAFPSVTLIDLRLIINQLANLLAQLGYLIKFLLIFSLTAGLLVTFALLQASQEVRQQENFLLNLFGATPNQLKWRFRLEIALLAGLAGVFAALLSEITYALLLTQLLEIK